MAGVGVTQAIRQAILAAWKSAEAAFGGEHAERLQSATSRPSVDRVRLLEVEEFRPLRRRHPQC
jgi:hypothetical protein